MESDITRSKLEKNERLYWYACICDCNSQFYLFDFCLCVYWYACSCNFNFQFYLFIGFIFVVF